VLLSGGIVAGAMATWVVRTANSAKPLSSLTQRNVGSLTEVYASDGKTRLGFIQSDDLVRPVPSSEFPDVLKQATIAIEDERFYKHKGVDYEGIIRAAVKNATAKGKTVQGGSTLTMQLVRLLYTQDDTRDGIAGYERKIKEAKLARDLEAKYSKKWVVGKYLNSVPYGTVGGQTAIGAGAAARLYFNKPVSKLSLRQAAMLAGMPQAPSQYSPIHNEAGTIRRRNEVLTKMAELGYITPERARTEKKKGLGLNMKDYFQKARERYVLDYVQSELVKQYGADSVKRGGFKVYTTIDLSKQREARAAIEERMGDIGPSAAIATINPRNGDILAMASSQEYGKSKYNLAAQGKRQPGSAFKTMVLMTALRMGVDPNSTSYVSRGTMKLDDPPCGSPASPWDVKTYSGQGGGSKNLVSATLSSDNVIYAQLTADLGPDKVKETARMMGIKSELHGYCAESLGGLERGVSPLEMANAYATIANGGYRNRPRAIKKIVGPDGDKLKLPRRWRVKRTKAFEDGVTYEATKILEQNIQSGTGTHAAIGCPAAGKTGTTDKNIDAWFVGFTPRLSTAVWVGFPGDARRSMNGMYVTGGNIDGGTYPADIWGTYMKKAAGSYCGEFKRPSEPFSSQPFQGHYAREGGKEDDESTDPSDAQVPAPGTETEPSDDTGGDSNRGGDRGAGNDGAAFDPNEYETPPQGAPETVAPGGGTKAPGDG
jgi:penicillin-binding protein 1A